MTLFYLFVLALVQGITEFLPISSSAHLILVPQFMGVDDQGLTIDVAVHVGTLFAVLVYFHKDVAGMVRGGLALFAGQAADEDGLQQRHLAANIMVGVLPVLVAGVLLYWSGLEPLLRSVLVIGWASIGFGLLLWAADRFGDLTQRLEGMTLRPAIIIGMAQILALIPGTSRAGITITAARLLGYAREDSARFSMLLAMPVIGAAGLLGLWDIVTSENVSLGADAVIAALIAFLTALATIAIFIRMTRRFTMLPFVIYRCLLGLLLLLIGYQVGPFS